MARSDDTALLALGGYSSVYSRGRYALKVCRRDSKDCRWLFLVREVERHARLPPHRNVLPLLGAYLDEMNVVAITPLQAGTLRRLISERSLSRQEVRRLRPQLSGALAHLHRSRLIHCDVKPENVLLSSPGSVGSVLVSDFGISLSCDEYGVAIAIGQQIGSVGYRAPELADVEPASLVTGAVDSWALGCTLLNALGVPTAPRPGESERDLAARLSLLARGPEALLLRFCEGRRISAEAFESRHRSLRREQWRS